MNGGAERIPFSINSIAWSAYGIVEKSPAVLQFYGLWENIMELSFRRK
jgi:hypothetical protein